MASIAKPALFVDMWSDFMCPFCWIGKRKFEIALKDLGYTLADAAGRTVDSPADSLAPNTAYIRFRAFELDPNGAAVNPTPLVDILSSKYGMPKAVAQANLEGMKGEAAKIGITFNWDIARTCNTFDAHRLLHWAEAETAKARASSSASSAATTTVTVDLKERLLKAYFTVGEVLSDVPTLERIAAELKLDPKAAAAALADKTLFAAEVRADEAAARRMNTNGVPYFLLNNGKASINGAQPPEAMKAQILKALQ